MAPERTPHRTALERAPNAAPCPLALAGASPHFLFFFSFVTNYFILSLWLQNALPTAPHLNVLQTRPPAPLHLQVHPPTFFFSSLLLLTILFYHYGSRTHSPPHRT